MLTSKQMEGTSIVPKDIDNLMCSTAESGPQESEMIRSMHQNYSEMMQDLVTARAEVNTSVNGTDKASMVITDIVDLPEGEGEYKCLELLTEEEDMLFSMEKQRGQLQGVKSNVEAGDNIQCITQECL